MRYTSRDVQSNIQNLVEDIGSMTHLWKPGSESDPGMVLLKALAANVDLLSFNLDTQVDEMYMQSATQIKSIRRLGVANGYQPSWYRAARVSLTITNTSETDAALDFSLPQAANNVCFGARNALDNLTSIPYFIIPKSPLWNADRPVLHAAGSTDVLGPTDTITRTAAQGILKSVIVNPAMLNPDGRSLNNLSYRLPAQNVDGELIWVEELSPELNTSQIDWTQDGSSGFIDGTHPCYQVAVDDYNNIIVMFNRFINDTIQAKRLIRVYYLETYGTAGEVAEDVIMLSSVEETTAARLKVTHPGNTMDIPDGSALTGRAPMTASEAAADAKNWVNTNSSIITLHNFTAWIRRQAGISTGVAVDCQKALELNWAIRYDPNMADEIKPLKYLLPGNIDEGYDFPNNVDSNGRVWDPIESANLNFPGGNDDQMSFPSAFLVYKLMYFCVFNNFLEYWNNGVDDIQTAEWGTEQPTVENPYRRYRPSTTVRNMLKKLYADTHNLSCSIDFGYLRVFEWSVNGVIYTNAPITPSDEESLISTVMAALRTRFNAANMSLGELPRLMDVVECVQGADRRIRYFDAGLLNVPMIEWGGVRDWEHRVPNSSIKYDINYFNYISFARFIDGDTDYISPKNRVSKISVARECILPEVRG